MESRAERISKILSDKKGEEIEVFDLIGRDYIVDYVVIATSMAGKHSMALIDSLKSELKPLGERFFATDEENEDWIVADLGEIMVHIFTENHRKKFNLEEFLTSMQKRELSKK